MEYKSFWAHIEVDDGFNCPYCGRKIETLNVGFAKYSPGHEVFFGFGGCCDAADDSLFTLPADTALSYATLPELLDVMRGKLDERRRGA